MANDRVSQLPVEVALLPTDAKLRVSQEPVETILAPTSAMGRVSQLVIEAIILVSRETVNVSIID